MGLGAITRALRNRFPEPAELVPDADLIARFLENRDQVAFEVLVWRHAVMVAGVCRRIVADEHLAEDAFQAVFLVLARKAGSVHGTNLAGWLFRIARRVALRARKQAYVRTVREVPLVADLARDPPPFPLEQIELRAVIDDEVARLPERFRLPVLLCYLGGRSTDEAALQLRCPRGTILSRLATARARLAVRLRRRGLTLPAVALSCFFGNSTLSSFASVVPDTVRLVCSPTASHSAAALLAEGVVKAMSTGRTIAAMAMFVAAMGMVCGFGFVAAQPTGTESPRTETAQPAPNQAEPPKNPLPKNEEAERLRRDERMRTLERLIDTFRAELQAKEKAIQLVEANALPGSDAILARLRNQVTRLDDEIGRLELDSFKLEAQLEQQKARLASDRFPISDQELARAVDSDPRVLPLVREKALADANLERVKETSVPDSPPVRQQQANVEQSGKKLEATRNQVRPEVEASLKAAAQEQLRADIAQRETKLAESRIIINFLTRERDRAEKKLEVVGKSVWKSGIDIRELRAELEPLRDALLKLESELLHLRIERNLPSSPNGTDAKLDQVLIELKELRREVRELKKP
jgi:RNA polymerase sigma factor (sigma-70 family)